VELHDPDHTAVMSDLADSFKPSLPNGSGVDQASVDAVRARRQSRTQSALPRRKSTVPTVARRRRKRR
jgi:hypothetical protein